MSTNPIATAGRRSRTEHYFGQEAVCVRCGISEPRAMVPIHRRYLEAHHVCARANDAALTVPVCRNCHAILTEGQRAAGVSFDPPPTLLHQLAAALRSFFSMLFELSEVGMGWARGLSALATDLDAAYPQWRELPSAQTIGRAT